MVENKPHFLICGAQKGGTRALLSYLQQHPDIYCSDRELNYFSFRYGKGFDWYLKQFKKARFGQIIGEKSPQYMYIKSAPERIKYHLPNVKLIFILRDPAKRAYSHYWMNILKGKEKRANFSDVIRNWEEKPEPCIHNYVSRGFYDEQIDRYWQLFDEKQILIITSDELRRDYRRALSKVCLFLGVDNIDFKKLVAGCGGVPKSRFLSYLLSRKEMNMFPRLRMIIQKLNKGDKYPKMKQDDYNFLRNIYETKSKSYLAFES